MRNFCYPIAIGRLRTPPRYKFPTYATWRIFARPGRFIEAETKALRKLKHPSRSDKLRSFIDTL